jgi:hypothetical protein
MTDAVILPNAGSTSLKLGAYGVGGTKTLPLLCRGQIDSMRGDPHFVVKDKNDMAFGRPSVRRGPGDQSQDSLAVRDHLVGIQDSRHQGRGGTR